MKIAAAAGCVQFLDCRVHDLVSFPLPSGCTIGLSGPKLHGIFLPRSRLEKMNVHVSYKVQKTPDIEKEVNQQIEKIKSGSRCSARNSCI